MAGSATCQDGASAPADTMSALRESRSTVAGGRHKCAICAYAEGYGRGLSGGASSLDAVVCEHGSAAPEDLGASLHENQGGPGRHKCVVCAYASGVEAGDDARTARWASSPFPEEVPDVGPYVEGSVTRVTINRYERDAVARQRCIEHYGCTCSACGIDFAERYGDMARGLIHVHHLRLLSELGPGYEVDPLRDLRPVCPNCHAVIHARNPPYQISDIQEALRRRAAASGPGD